MSESELTVSGPPVPTSALLEFRMSNAELADAITAAYRRAGTSNEEQRIHLEHMKTLLAIQLCRAKTVVSEDSNTSNERRQDRKGERR